MSEQQKSKSLIHIIAESNLITQKIMEAEGEITDEILALLDSHEKELAVKIDNYGGLMERLDLEASYWKAMRQKCQQVEKGCNKTKEFLKERLKIAIGPDEKSIEGEVFRFTKSKTNPRLEIDENKLPAKWLMEIVEYKPDKDRIKDALLNGEKILGAQLVQGETVRKFIKSRT